MGGSPLLATLRDTIRDEGPIGLDRFMALALAHPRYGYYMTRDPLGAAGDFTTAPEISQMFGEMVGVWCATVFTAMGSPGRFHLVELGPGRGTLMADLLRTAALVPAFREAADIQLVETSPVLRAQQAAVLGRAGVSPRWHTSLDTVPDGPAIVVANEFFDALPVRHYLRAPDGWHERLVGLGPGEGLAFGIKAEPEPALTLRAPAGTVLELGLAAQAVMAALAARLSRDGGAALVIDYGYTSPRFGESLQALRRHAAVDPLDDPGEADLTAHVDFAALVRAAAAAGAAVHGPATQGEVLRALGIETRAMRLAGSQPARAGEVRRALDRLAGPAPGMGELFKVLAVSRQGLTGVPGFATGPDV